MKSWHLMALGVASGLLALGFAAPASGTTATYPRIVASCLLLANGTLGANCYGVASDSVAPDISGGFHTITLSSPIPEAKRTVITEAADGAMYRTAANDIGTEATDIIVLTNADIPAGTPIPIKILVIQNAP